MCRLSIIVPLLDNPQPFEDTLVSVLQNRPSDCEVLVVHRGPYDDPYELDGEVRFVEIPADGQLIDAINAGFSAAIGEIVHVLQPGVLAKEGWAKHALEHFDDSLIGAVSPVVLRTDDEDTIHSAGVRYTLGGRRLLNGRGRKVKNVRRIVRRKTIGPSLAAGFYRRSVVEALGGFCATAGSKFSDVDMGLCLKALVYDTVVEPASAVVGDAADNAKVACFRSGRRAERIFWRHAGTNGWLRSMFFHPFAVAGELVAGWKRPSTYASLLGRTVGMIQSFFCRGKDEARIEKATRLLEGDSWPQAIPLHRFEYAEDGPTSAANLEEPRRRAA